MATSQIFGAFYARIVVANVFLPVVCVCVCVYVFVCECVYVFVCVLGMSVCVFFVVIR